VNVFVAEHPLVSAPSPALLRLQRRLWRVVLIVLFGYPVYLLSLGPLWALDGRRILDFIPEGIRQTCYLPSYPIWAIPHLRGRYADYLDWWYLDPNAVDRETGWD
jgi:hypothetical protein